LKSPLNTELGESAKTMDCKRELALLMSTLNQEKLANELLVGPAKGKAPLKKLVEKTSLKKAGATLS
jgi:hypothetical protein